MNDTTFLKTKWQQVEYDKDLAREFSEKLGIPEEISGLIISRNIKTIDEAYDFLNPSLNNLPSPFTMKGMTEAVDLIVDGYKTNSKFVIYGDYDVDGVTGVALLARFAKLIDIDFVCIHPNRFKDGYGLKSSVIEELGISTKGIIITVDCGISDIEEVEKLKQNGWKIIITDHHQPPDSLPRANAIINPWQNECSFEFKELSGVGVAFYLIMGLRSYLQKKKFWTQGNEPNLKIMLDLVAVGTISDMVPLLGINRLLVKAGLEVLKNTQNHGLQELLLNCDIGYSQDVTSEDISYSIGPRINAAGRMGDALKASTLLSTTNLKIAKSLSKLLEDENKSRREITHKLFTEANELARLETKSPCIVLHGENWHQGIIGIATSKLLEIYNKPVIIFSGLNKLKGSARSVPGINIHTALMQCSELLIEFGGHNAAAGMSIYEENLEKFKKKICLIVEEQTKGNDIYKELQIICINDKKIEINDFFNHEQKLQPFGQGNQEPVYTIKNLCSLRNLKGIGKDKNHLKFSVFLFGAWINGIGFGFGDILKNINSDNINAKIAFTIKNNRFKGQTFKQIQLQDIILSHPECVN